MLIGDQVKTKINSYGYLFQVRYIIIIVFIGNRDP